MISETELDDPHLQVDGLLHRLRLRIEKPRREWQLTDSQKMKYRLKSNGLSTFLYDDNWKIGIVSIQEAPFYLSRGEALEKAGFYPEAVEIYTSLSILNHFESSEANQSLSLTAIKRLEKLAEKVSNSPDPVLFIDNNVLNIVSQLSRFHIQLPNDGNGFRFIREPTLRLKDGRIEQILKIATGKKRILIFLDIFASTEWLSLGGYTEYCDMKRGFDRSRKLTVDFNRECNSMSCSVSFKEKGESKGWQEITTISGQTGFMITVTPVDEESNRYVNSVKSTIRFGKK
ncbi:MAG: hypothetical protein H3C43_08835 [Leptonema sp. (in: Bacteria)]|nr:hypothetical protein [Leptonema sp. (in: bacteria)]